MNRFSSAPGHRKAFTLLELLTAMAVVALLVTGLMMVADRTGSVWVRGENQIETRRNARASLHLISRDLRNAVLPVAGVPAAGASNLRFVLNPADSGLPPEILNPDALFWQATTASDATRGEIATVGYFVRLTSEAGAPKLKLCRFFVNPSAQDDYRIYQAGTGFDWLSPAILDAYTSASADTAEKFRGLLAEDVLGFWVRCLDPDGEPITQTAALDPYPGNRYDSNLGYAYRDGTIAVSPPALPAAVEITLVILDSRSAARLSAADVARFRTEEPADAAALIATLPEPLRASARVVSTKILLPRS